MLRRARTQQLAHAVARASGNATLQAAAPGYKFTVKDVRVPYQIGVRYPVPEELGMHTEFSRCTVRGQLCHVAHPSLHPRTMTALCALHCRNVTALPAVARRRLHGYLKAMKPVLHTGMCVHCSVFSLARTCAKHFKGYPSCTRTSAGAAHSLHALAARKRGVHDPRAAPG